MVCLVALVLLLGACGEDGLPAVGAPEGQPVMPDLVPVPPVDVRTTTTEGGSTLMRFSSTLANIGAGEFLLRASRDEGEWEVEQEITYSESGGELSPTEATVIWGGDGHEHWHIERVASYRLVPLSAEGEPVEDGSNLVDSKIGFCFFDHSAYLETGPEEEVHSVHACGHVDDTQLRMGMSSGWADVYPFTLPGQSINIDEVPDGAYRLWAEADAAGWFREADRSNNITWVDIELSTAEDGRRRALVVEVGPEPGKDQVG